MAKHREFKPTVRSCRIFERALANHWMRCEQDGSVKHCRALFRMERRYGPQAEACAKLYEGARKRHGGGRG